MTERPPGQIITFYSYKGGVGRSMALANLAVLLAQRHEAVLVIDMDLEAPGLHRYLHGGMWTPVDLGTKAPLRKGTIEFFYDLHARLLQRYPVPESLGEADFSEAQAAAVAIIRELLDSGAYTEEVYLRDPNDPEAKPHLHFMPAGRFDEAYPERVRGFDWRGLYETFPFVFSALAQELGRRHQYVLVDSRTGITDVGGVCTALLPTKLVLVFSPNEQSLHGAVEIGRQAALHRAVLDAGRPLPLFPLPARVDVIAEEEQTRYWLGQARRRFEHLFREVYGPERGDLSAYFEQVRIQHKPYYAFGEKIAAELSKETEAQSLTADYARFLRFLERDEARAERSGPHGGVSEAGAGDGLLLISIGGDSLWPVVKAERAELGLASVPDSDVLDIPVPRFVEPDVAHWTLLAAEIRNRLRPWINDPRYQRFHLFYRGPVVMAPLLGALIVPSKPLLIYYYENGRYRLAYTCDRRLVQSR